MAESTTFDINYRGEKREVSYSSDQLKSTTVGDLKQYICGLFSLEPSTCKILGLVKGKLPQDGTSLESTLQVNNNNNTTTNNSNNKSAAQPLASPRPNSRIKLTIMGTQQAVLQLQHHHEKEVVAQRQAELVVEEMERAEELEREAKERIEEQQRRFEQQQQQLAHQRRMAEERRQRALMGVANQNGDQEHDQHAKVQFELVSHSAAFANRTNLDAAHGGRVVLPATVLEQCVSKRVVFPLIFRMTPLHPRSHKQAQPMETEVNSGSEEVKRVDDSSSSSTIVRVDPVESPNPPEAYVGAHEFDAPEGQVLLPQLLIEQLGVEEGDQVKLENVQLVKGTFARLQPLSPFWFEIPQIEREALLEFELRKYQLLYKGMNFVFTYNGKEVRFSVLETKPQDAVVITDTDLQTDIAPPLESHKTPKKIELKLGGDVELALKADEYQYFQFELEDPNQAFVLEATTKEQDGDVDLYVSPASVGVTQPSHTNYVWCSQSMGPAKINLSNSQSLFSVGKYFAAVRAFGKDALAKVSLTHVAIVPKDETKISKTLDDTDALIQEKGYKKCENCLKAVPPSAIVMHEVQCRRYTYRCPTCGILCKVQEKNKHQTLVHTQYTCDCGQRFEQEALQHHRQHECECRLVQCLYCNLKVTAAARGAHQGECGSRQATCRECGSVYKRKEIRRHISKQHNRDISTITPADFS